MEVIRYETPSGIAEGTAVIGAKGFVFLSGVVGRDPQTGEVPPTIEGQLRIAWNVIMDRLDRVGSSVECLCHNLTCMVGQFPNGIYNEIEPGYANLADLMVEIWQERYGPKITMKHITGTLLGVTALALPEFLVEVYVVAYIP